jgi:anti-sigma factor RsiW
MTCDSTRTLIDQLRDGTLPDAERRSVIAHLETCVDCKAVMTLDTHIARHIAEGATVDVPPRLRAKVMGALDAEDRAEGAKVGAARAETPRRGRPTWAQAAAAAVLVGVVSAAGGWAVRGNVQERDLVTTNVLQAHVRSLLQDNPVQVASSDSHTVRPWFAGKIALAPGVRDFAAEGFPLVGGRLDVIGPNRAAVVVYKRNLHWINVYMWPVADDIAEGPSALTRNGYNMLRWTRGGVAHWAVSDLNLAELRQFQGLLGPPQ